MPPQSGGSYFCPEIAPGKDASPGSLGGLDGSFVNAMPSPRSKAVSGKAPSTRPTERGFIPLRTGGRTLLQRRQCEGAALRALPRDKATPGPAATLFVSAQVCLAREAPRSCRFRGLSRRRRD
jgi:hypothetical protein